MPSQSDPYVQDDLLHHIATFIARVRNDEETTSQEPHAITTICCMCRVNSQWRDLIMSSSSIWGEMFDMNFMKRVGAQGREEMLKRSDKAKLVIYGRVSKKEHIRDFFTSLLKDNWGRIKELNVRIFRPQIFDPKLWELFSHHRATDLVHFEITFAGNSYTSTLDRDTEDILSRIRFSDYAPSLTTFKCVNLGFNPLSPWVSKLHRISVGRLSVLTITDMLRYMPKLQELNLGKILPISSSDREKLSPVSLPSLERLSISSSAAMCITMLEHIVIGNMFSCFGIAIKEFSISHEEIQELVSAASPFIQQIFTLNIVDTLQLSISGTIFYLEGNHAPAKKISLSILCTNPIPTSFHRLIISNISQNSLKSVKKFNMESEFGIHHTNSYIVSRLSSEDENCREILSLLLPALPALTEITLCEESAALLKNINYERPWPCPSPALEKIVIDAKWSEPTQISATVVESLMEFLSLRQEAGYAPPIFDASSFLNHHRNFQSLESIRDLRVQWYRRGIRYEYVCGSGVPQTLYFPEGCVLSEK